MGLYILRRILMLVPTLVAKPDGAVPFMRHIIMRLPDEAKAEFIYMVPFTPRGKENLAAWMVVADERTHGTTHEAPIVRFDRDERTALRPLPVYALPRREQRYRRRVAHDALVDLDTVRYSVPHRLVRDHVDVVVDEQVVRIFHGTALVATHARSCEPFARVIDPAHYAGLWREPATDEPLATSPLALLGRDLTEYAAVVAGGGQ